MAKHCYFAKERSQTGFITIPLLQLTMLFTSLVSMQKYLNQFQYLSMSRSGNHDVKQALRSFQSFAGLKVTGRLDRATVKQMKKPRCGMPDGGGGSGDRFRRYATYSKWRKTRLTYFIQHGRDLSQGQQDRIFAKALKYWADVSGLSFQRVSSPRSADLKIRLAILFVFLLYYILLNLLLIVIVRATPGLVGFINSSKQNRHSLQHSFNQDFLIACSVALERDVMVVQA